VQRTIDLSDSVVRQTIKLELENPSTSTTTENFYSIAVPTSAISNIALIQVRDVTNKNYLKIDAKPETAG
jgi:hypothetical protein